MTLISTQYTWAFAITCGIECGLLKWSYSTQSCIAYRNCYSLACCCCCCYCCLPGVVEVTQNGDLFSEALVLSGERFWALIFPEQLYRHGMTVVCPLHHLSPERGRGGEGEGGRRDRDIRQQHKQDRNKDIEKGKKRDGSSEIRRDKE